MSTPAKLGHGAEEEEEEEERGTGTTLVRVGRRAESEESGKMSTTPVKVGGGAEEERGTGTTPAKVARRIEVDEEERRTGTKPVEVKAEAGGDGSLINITVHSQTAADASFRVRRDVKLERLINMYCGKHSLNPKSVVFLDPYGRNIRADQTPAEAGLEDGDTISVHLHQLGGTGAPLHASQSSA
ncbi:small ubiquitin-related modifier 1-like [Panicum miliaceum]|uniref:Small ubiquitin-related modifier 1-like n=1 Tax=Panicum miliaceum TaxID=4540 RepID=A0A3L6SQS1_PANMI|nr:small ubiquitin-related modifier 1-like [Panicum miliaceum]